MDLKEIYKSLEDKYYDQVEKFHLDKITDPIDKFVPSFIVFIAIIAAIIIIAAFFIISLLVPAGFSATILVLDSDTGSALEEVDVLVFFDEQDHTFTTDSFGEVVITGIINPEVIIDVFEAGYDDYTETVTLEANLTFEVLLDPEGISGSELRTLYIKDKSNNKTITDSAEVSFSCSGSAAAPGNLTRSGGSVEVTYPLGCGDLTATVIVSGYETGTKVISGTVTTIHLTPITPPTGILIVNVTESVSGDPVSGLDVKVYNSSDSWVDQAKTDATGAASFELDTGAYSVRVIDTRDFPQYNNEQSSSKTVRADETETIDIAVSRLSGEAKKLVLKFVDANSGDAVSGADISVYVDGVLERDAPTDSTGKVSFTNTDENSDLVVVAQHYDYLLKIVSSGLTLVPLSSTDAIEIELEKATESNAGTVNVIVKELDGSDVSSATVQLYVSGHSFYIATEVTGSDGLVSFTNMPSGSYYAHASKNTDDGNSSTVSLSAGGEITLNVVLVLAEGSLKVSVKDSEGDPVAGAIVKFYDAGTNTKLAESTTSSQGTTEIVSFKWDKRIYFTVSKASYMPFTSIVQNLVPNQTDTLDVVLSDIEDYSDVELGIKLMGVLTDKMKKATKFSAGKDYYLQYNLIVGEETLEEVELVVVTGLDNGGDANAANLAIIPPYVNIANAEVVASEKYNKDTPFEALEVTDEKARQLNISLSNVAPGIYEFLVEVNAKANAQADDPIEVRYGARAEAEDLRKPATGLYLDRYAIGRAIECTSNCPNFIFSFEIEDPNGEYLPEPVEVVPGTVQPLLSGIDYILNFEISNWSQAKEDIYDTGMQFTNNNAALDAVPATVTIPKLEYGATFAGDVTLTPLMETAATTLTAEINVLLENNSEVLTFSVQGIEEMEISIYPAELYGGIYNPLLLVTVTDKETSEPVEDALVEILHVATAGNTEIDSDFTNSSGKAFFFSLPRYDTGETLLVKITKSGYADAETTIEFVSPRETFLPEYDCIDFSSEEITTGRYGPASFEIFTDSCPEEVHITMSSDIFNLKIYGEGGSGSKTLQTTLSETESKIITLTPVDPGSHGIDGMTAPPLGQDSIVVQAYYEGEHTIELRKLTVKISEEGNDPFSMTEAEFDMLQGSYDGVIENRNPGSGANIGDRYLGFADLEEGTVRLKYAAGTTKRIDFKWGFDVHCVDDASIDYSQAMEWDPTAELIPCDGEIIVGKSSPSTIAWTEKLIASEIESACNYNDDIFLLIQHEDSKFDWAKRYGEEATRDELDDLLKNSDWYASAAFLNMVSADSGDAITEYDITEDFELIAEDDWALDYRLKPFCKSQKYPPFAEEIIDSCDPPNCSSETSKINCGNVTGCEWDFDQSKCLVNIVCNGITQSSCEDTDGCTWSSTPTGNYICKWWNDGMKGNSGDYGTEHVRVWQREDEFDDLSPETLGIVCGPDGRCLLEGPKGTEPNFNSFGGCEEEGLAEHIPVSANEKLITLTDTIGGSKSMIFFQYLVVGNITEHIITPDEQADYTSLCENPYKTAVRLWTADLIGNGESEDEFRQQYGDGIIEIKEGTGFSEDDILLEWWGDELWACVDIESPKEVCDDVCPMEDDSDFDPENITFQAVNLALAEEKYAMFEVTDNTGAGMGFYNDVTVPLSINVTYDNICDDECTVDCEGVEEDEYDDCYNGCIADCMETFGDGEGSNINFTFDVGDVSILADGKTHEIDGFDLRDFIVDELNDEDVGLSAEGDCGFTNCWKEELIKLEVEYISPEIPEGEEESGVTLAFDEDGDLTTKGDISQIIYDGLDASVVGRSSISYHTNYETDYFHTLLKTAGGECYKSDGTVGATGANAIGRTLLSWQWDKLQLNSSGYGLCDVVRTTEYIYCDSVQFAKEIALKLIEIDEQLESGDPLDIGNYLSFETYLMADGYSDDFLTDLDEYIMETEFAGAPVAYTETNGINEYFSDTTAFKFVLLDADGTETEQPILTVPGLYRAIINLEIEDSDYGLFKNDLKNAEITVALALVDPAVEDKLVYYLPFDGEIGIDGSGKLHRDGYGIGYQLLTENAVYIVNNLEESGEVLYARENAAGSSPIKTMALNYIESMETLNGNSDIESRGMVLKITANEITFSPSDATPVMMKLLGDEGVASSLYAIRDSENETGDLTDLGQFGTLWNGIASTMGRGTIQCTYFNDAEMFLNLKDDGAGELDHACEPGTVLDSTSYGFSEAKESGTEDDEFNDQFVYLRGIFYTPAEHEVSLKNACDEARTFYTIGHSTAGASEIPLSFSRTFATGQIMNSLDRVFSLVEDNKMCAVSNENTIEVWWNEEKINSAIEQAYTQDTRDNLCYPID